MQIAFALVHHANQYLITDGYSNREGLKEVVGHPSAATGLRRVLEVHRRHQIPASIHISGTLLEALVWHYPQFVLELQDLRRSGLVEFIGSCYGQNIMRFFGYEHNLRQLNEELRLFELHLGVSPEEVTTFWPPERVWDTERMAPVLTDPALLNRGYQHVILDDRLFLPLSGNPSPRLLYDRQQGCRSELFQMCRIKNGQGLVALPIAHNLRQSIPPRSDQHWERIITQLQWLSKLDKDQYGDLIAIYGDDMEKPAGVGWDRDGTTQFEAFLAVLKQNPSVRPVKLGEWARSSRVAGSRTIEAGTYLELAEQFEAGESYEKWFFGPSWCAHASLYKWTEKRVRELAQLGADGALIELAHKQLLATSWETAWHTPATGAHGDSRSGGHPSPWSRALASHSRHAAVIAEAAYWMRHRDEEAHAYLCDIDNDAAEELILKNDKLFAVLSPCCGGRLIFLFDVAGNTGVLSIGNPCDDWNLMEELNQYMDEPRNHPGALADVGFEHDRYLPRVMVSDGAEVQAEIRNVQSGSRAQGLVKRITLAFGESSLRVDYALPETLAGIDVEFGLSPDYLRLLRHGRHLLCPLGSNGTRGCKTGDRAVWIKPNGNHSAWAQPHQQEFGHGCAMRLAGTARQLSLFIGVSAE